MNEIEKQTIPANTTPDFINERELLKRLPVSRRTLFSWRMTGKIPSVRLGGRRVLFHWPSIEAALLRMQKGGVQ
jgi:predicted DNA-binding transcriptional regulator AlpA